MIGAEARALLLRNPAEFVQAYACLLPIYIGQIESVPFDPDWYMRLYPDVGAAVKDGKFASAYEHFQQSGFMAGRLGAPMEVDENWYRNAYPDIDEAVSQGRIPSATMHFRNWGFFEGRAASGFHRVDRNWYKATYRSAAWEIELGQFRTPQDHYNRRGYPMGFWASEASAATR
jgi:hypothetical protein